MAEHAVDPARVYVAGLSAGGALAAIMGATYPDLYAAVGVHSGLPVGAAHSIPSALAAMSKGPRAVTADRTAGRAVPTIIFHGDRDTTVNPRNGERLAADATADTLKQQSTVVEARVPGGKAYTRTVYSEAAGVAHCEFWRIQGGGHAWSGGSATGTYTDPTGPNATREMLRFFLQHQVADTRTLESV
jgi:poly(3-hydroxybutyrate) depolymerase